VLSLIQKHTYVKQDFMNEKDLFYGLYLAKIHDNGTQYTEKDYNLFINQVKTSYEKGIIDFSNQYVGMGVLTKLTMVLRTSPHIWKFDFYGNMIQDHGINALYQLLLVNPRITVIDIGCNSLSYQAVPSIIDIINHTKVRSLQLGMRGIGWHHNLFPIPTIVEILSNIVKSKRIQQVGLSGLKLCVRQGARKLSIANELASFLSIYSDLRVVSISNCNFSPIDAEIIANHGLVYSNSIRVLDISFTPFGEPLGSSFLNNIYKMKNLCRLDISNCHLTEEACIGLATSMRKGLCLIYLNISNNSIGLTGFNSLLDSMLEADSLVELNVSNNNIDYGVCDKLEMFIGKSNVINVFDISGNPIGDKCAIAIANSISNNVSLTDISLASCKLTDVGATELIRSVSQNKILVRLDISDNFLTQESGYSIIEFLKENEVLTHLDLSATQINHFVITATQELCKRNKQIRREISLEPLKKQLVKLSIQRTKMPEAQTRLNDLSDKLGKTEETINKTRFDFESYVRDSNHVIEELSKTIASKVNAIQMEKKEIDTINAQHEKISNETNEKILDIVGLTEKTRVMIEKVKTEILKVENDTVRNREESESELNHLKAQVTEMKEMTQKTREILESPDQIKSFVMPNLDFLEEIKNDPVFLVNQILDERQSSKKGKRSENSGRSKKSTKRPNTTI